ncbi:MAG TPA: HNH endonuclease, partial [Acidobacteriota bacterium]
LDAFLSQIPEKVPREHRIFERDGWMCQAPGCFSRCGLQAHHVIPRSQGGGNEDANLLTLCFWCHHHGVHGRKLRCAGRAPDDLAWAIGWRADGPPLLRFRNGTKIQSQRCSIARHPERTIQSDRGKGTQSNGFAAHGTAAARA